MEKMEFNLPKIVCFLYCHSIQQDVLTKNFELKGVFQGFGPPGYPFGIEFMTFSRFSFEGASEFLVEISLFNSKGEKISENVPKKIAFNEAPYHDLITAWRVVLPEAGEYIFKVFCNNLNLGEYKFFCR